MPYNLLFVDDYQANCMMCTDLLEITGNTVTVAHNGLEAVDKIKEGEIFDAILMDVNMPVMDGLEATRAIRQLAGGEKILIIGMSGDGVENYDECIASGMTMVVGKPFYPEHIIEIITKYKENPVAGLADVPQNNSPKDEPDGTSILPVFDYVKVVKDFEGDASLVNAVLEEFLQELVKHCSLMDAYIKKSDFIALKQEAHKVKGGAVNICAARLAQAAKNIEACCAEGDVDKAEKAVGHFKEESKTFGTCALQEIKNSK